MKLVLVDRDGVVAEERPGYVTTPAELHIYPHAFEALALLHERSFTTVLITNQSVVGRGIITDKALGHIHEYLRDTVRAHGGELADIFYCTDHPDRATYRRKPKPGMLLEALAKYDAKAEDTPFIGDALSDLEASHAAGCPRYLVLTGKGLATSRAIPPKLLPVAQAPDLLAAARLIAERWR